MRLLITCLWAAVGWKCCAADQPQWGQAWSRNMVSSERGLPTSFDPKTGKNIKWAVRIGTETHSTPIIAGGRIYIGTNNRDPRDPKHQGDRGVLMCFNERDGQLLWQLVVPKRHEDAYFDWPFIGMSSPATVEGERLYILDNRGEVLCLDTRGMANGNGGPFLNEAAHMTASYSESERPTQQPGAEIQPEPLRPPANGVLLKPGPLDADILWTFDLVAGAGIWPHDGAHSSILVHGNYLYVNTSTGVDNTHKRIRRPDAPSLVVLDKRTGRLVARDNERIGPNIFHNTWSSPSLAEVNGRTLVFFNGGNGVVYGFEPVRSNPPRNAVLSLKSVWQFDFDPAAPKENVHRFNNNRSEGPSNIYGMPVFHRNRIYVAGGGDLWWGKNAAWLKCIDATKTGDVTTNGLVWTYPLERKVMSTAAVHDGLVFVADCRGFLHCVDATTGAGIWKHEIQGEAWASPMVADGKIYLGTRTGNYYVLAASREKQVLSTVKFGEPISATATPANRVLYVASMSWLYAVQEGAQFSPKTQDAK